MLKIIFKYVIIWFFLVYKIPQVWVLGDIDSHGGPIKFWLESHGDHKRQSVCFLAFSAAQMDALPHRGKKSCSPPPPSQSFSFSRMRVISIYSWDHRWTEATIILLVRTTAQSSLLACKLTTIPEGNRILRACSLPFWLSPPLTWELRRSHKPPILSKLLRSRLVLDWIGAGMGRPHWTWMNYHIPPSPSSHCP